MNELEMNKGKENLVEGCRVLAFDHRLYVNDVITPLKQTMKPATVVCRYGYRSEYIKYMSGVNAGLGCIYPDCVDLIFDHSPYFLSKGHFTYGVKLLGEV